MRNRLLLIALCLSALWQAALSDVPFRNHRYESFKAVATNQESIVFAGNSITNMHEWWEAFGSDARVVNRGNSGGYTQEIIDNLETWLTGRPAKMFLMIGTNDLGTQGLNTPAYVAQNIRAIARRVVRESPTTKLYLQCILPSNNGLRSNDVTQRTNDSIRHICQELGPQVEYVDLWQTLWPMGNKSGTLGKTTNSYDNLHPNAWGYTQWCQQIAPQVGLPCAYPAEDRVQLRNGGYNDSWGARITQFASLPHLEGDVLIIGEEMIHQGEWHELLHSAHIKSRSSGWGNGDNNNGKNMDVVLKSIAPMFEGYDGVTKQLPSKLFLSAGQGRIISGHDITAVKNTLATIIDKIRQYCPNVPLYVMGSHPLAGASLNQDRVKPYNALVEDLCQTKGANYVDIYTPMIKSGTSVDPRFVDGNNYVVACGYARLSEILAPLMQDEGAAPTSVEEVENRLPVLNARNTLGSRLSALEVLLLGAVGDGLGQYSPQAVEPVRLKVDEAYALLAADPQQVSVDQLNAMTAALQEAQQTLFADMNMPQTSSEGKEVWYELRSARENRYATAPANIGGNLTGTASGGTERTQWKFTERPDGTLDIQSRADGAYVSPASAKNSALKTAAKQPAQGWTLSYSNLPGTFIISSGTVQFNQTNSGLGYAIYNWSANSDGQDRDDVGCRYYILPAEEPEPEPEPTVYTPLLTLCDVQLDGTQPYRVPDALAAPVLQSTEALTVAIDCTVSANATGSAASAANMLVGSVGDEAPNNISEYAGIVIRNGGGGYGLQYLGNANHTEGWYTDAAPANFSGRRTTIVMTYNTPRTTYQYYRNGAHGRADISSGMGDYGFRSLATVPGAHSLYLGGLTDNNGQHRFLTTGTLHSVRFYDEVLPADAILSLSFADLTPTPAPDPQPEPDAIATPPADGTSTSAYDLTGRRARTTQPGLYIVGGQKRIMK